ncbi:hypothetical protein [Motilibacter aurantiacus]|uniref:hypothetical protein n=1 Tax=Motilibacter aurantiacus TaxID=2714955 RepID=UPI00140C0F34|nr:hypothetical protein [Motilibacter aurantiacus]NHC43887.1 hypothetical protein [Motilibacter aurantiacus]
MASRVLLHVGLQKSGTTYLQHGLSENVDALAAAGVTYPVRRGDEFDVPNHQRAFYGLLRGEISYVSDAHAEQAAPTWEWLRAEIEQAPGAVLLSAEGLAFLRPSAVRRTVEALGVDDVTVLVTARDLARTLSSAWQQNVRASQSHSFEAFLAARAADRDAAARRDDEDVVRAPWRAYALADLVRRWGAVVGIDNVRVVTNAGSPPRLLWDRFLHALEVPGLTSLPQPKLSAAEAHVGLTWPEAELMASVNAVLREKDWPLHRANELRRTIIRDGLVPREERGPKIVIPAQWRAAVEEWAQADISGLRETGVRVVGDLADLEPRVPKDAEDVGYSVLEDIRAAAAAAVVAAAVAPPPGAKPAKAPAPAAQPRTPGMMERARSTFRRRVRGRRAHA